MQISLWKLCKLGVVIPAFDNLSGVVVKQYLQRVLQLTVNDARIATYFRS